MTGMVNLNTIFKSSLYWGYCWMSSMKNYHMNYFNFQTNKFQYFKINEWMPCVIMACVKMKKKWLFILPLVNNMLLTNCYGYCLLPNVNFMQVKIYNNTCIYVLD
jgi:hypothetical protein